MTTTIINTPKHGNIICKDTRYGVELYDKDNVFICEFMFVNIEQLINKPQLIDDEIDNNNKSAEFIF